MPSNPADSHWQARWKWGRGHVATRAFVDATVGPHDKIPFRMLHDEDVAFVVDPSSAEINPKAIDLEVTGLDSLPCTELNLRSIVSLHPPVSSGV